MTRTQQHYHESIRKLYNDAKKYLSIISGRTEPNPCYIRTTKISKEK